jgi:hypothetical protein
MAFASSWRSENHATVGCCLPVLAQEALNARWPPGVPWSYRKSGRNQMPVILWLLGVPLVVVILLMLFHVI